jgi:hypothetical protein
VLYGWGILKIETQRWALPVSFLGYNGLSLLFFEKEDTHHSLSSPTGMNIMKRFMQ